MHLPSIDFRAYKIGDNLLTNMSTPENAPKAVQEFTWTFDVDGKQKIITDGSYPDVNGDYVSVETKVIKEGYQPSILDFSIESETEDLTEDFLKNEKLVMVVSYSLESAESEGLEKLKLFSKNAKSKGYTVIGLSASGNDAKEKIQSSFGLDFEFYLCDEKALKTVVRSNPGVLILITVELLSKKCIGMILII